ncbi:energy transducer TonB [Mucilaginibacter xinganensis]|uniref:TonB family C-terminal domain-containing protein n=1 Tax=Mucilaginibacter xinganensis TaxID=1234841 RepID=A0A223NY48_9SPHI|nr:energy transducer TonB [Mucilaginibacter xinganensis]ASU34809.1 TonB family C-terminal domain-containing protein [Mucilaginibacter xinganensis]
MKRLLIISAAMLVLLFSFSIKTYSQTLTPPEFPRGKEAFSAFLKKNLKWPKDDDGGSQGIVIISFFVEKDGRLTEIKVAKSMGIAFDDEALHVMNLSPKWIPAMKNNKFIKSKYTVPIRFYITG